MACFINEQNVVQGENPVKVYITSRGKTVAKYQSNVPVKHSIVNRAFNRLSPALQLSILRRKAQKQADKEIKESPKKSPIPKPTKGERFAKLANIHGFIPIAQYLDDERGAISAISPEMTKKIKELPQEYPIPPLVRRLKVGDSLGIQYKTAMIGSRYTITDIEYRISGTKQLYQFYEYNSDDGLFIRAKDEENKVLIKLLVDPNGFLLKELESDIRRKGPVEISIDGYRIVDNIYATQSEAKKYTKIGKQIYEDGEKIRDEEIRRATEEYLKLFRASKKELKELEEKELEEKKKTKPKKKR
jgi:hypothetical protein